MAINKQSFKLAGVTEQEFKNWCKENKLQAYKPESKKLFFARIQSGQLVRDSVTNKLVRTNRRRRRLWGSIWIIK